MGIEKNKKLYLKNDELVAEPFDKSKKNTHMKENWSNC